MTSIYLSDWAPRGVRKDWERCSIGLADAARVIGTAGRIAGAEYTGQIIDACAWFAPNGNLRILVADTDTGKRLTDRRTARGSSLTIEAKP